jgi:hypothetical protein
MLVNRFILVALALIFGACAPHPARRVIAGGGNDGLDAAPVETGGSAGSTGGAGGTPAADTGGSSGTGGMPGTGGAPGTGGMPTPDAQPEPPDAAPMGGTGGSPADRPVDLAPPRPDLAPDVPPRPTVALLVAASTTLSAIDTTLRGRLTALGLSTVVTTPAAVTASDATGKAVVIISGTIDSVMLGTKLRDVPVPVLSMEPNIMDDMRLCADGSTVGSQTQLEIVDGTQPLAGGLEGVVAVYTSSNSLVQGTPAAGAVVVARPVGDAAHAVIYGYPTGAMMVGGTAAPAKRIGFFINDNQATITLTANGLKLFDAAIGWALTP